MSALKRKVDKKLTSPPPLLFSFFFSSPLFFSFFPPPESVLTLLASLTLAVVLGYFALGKLIVLLLYLKPNSRLPPKWVILPIGFGMFSRSARSNF